MKEKNIQFKPAATQRASEVIYNQIYQKIVSGELHHGDRLPAERELSEMFQRSRPSVREALRMLQQDGLIKITVGSAGGSIVQGFSMKTVEMPFKKLISANAINLNELLEYRHINDHGCARLAAVHRTDDDIAALKNTLSDALANVGNPLSFQEYDIAFHTALANASHNTLAILINDVIVGLNTDALRDVIRDFTLDQHRAMNMEIYNTHSAILEAVISQDPVEADARVDAMVELFRRLTDPEFK